MSLQVNVCFVRHLLRWHIISLVDRNNSPVIYFFDLKSCLAVAHVGECIEKAYAVETWSEYREESLKFPHEVLQKS